MPMRRAVGCGPGRKGARVASRPKQVTLVTWKGGANFGTSLQGWALQEVLEQLGYRVRFLSDLPAAYGVKSVLRWLLDKVGLLRLRHWLRAPKDPQFVKRMAWERRAYREVTVLTAWQERRLVRETDCFVTGSDQIWNTYHHFMPVQFLHFAQDRKRIAYASSIGTNSVNPVYADRVRDYLLRFQHLGVREQEAVRVLGDLTGRRDIVQVLDPTLLLDADAWRRFADGARFEVEIPGRYLFCYLVGANDWYVRQLLDVKDRLGFEHVVIVPAVENPDFAAPGCTVYGLATPPEFVWLLAHAACVCTDSFHATAFSINLQKPFVEFMRFPEGAVESQNSRIHDILSRYGLASRVYAAQSDAWTRPIDFAPVQARLDADRKASMDYLVNAIEN